MEKERLIRLLKAMAENNKKVAKKHPELKEKYFREAMAYDNVVFMLEDENYAKEVESIYFKEEN